ncbi:MAG: HAMP domain-containing protein [Nitrospirae bacterium]|nr:HAMP domain-containing protein [Nitrospirota bacterium]
MSIYREKSLEQANLISEDLVFMMTEEDPTSVIRNIDAFNKSRDVRIGVVGSDGRPAFKTSIEIPKDIFSSQKEQTLKSDGEFILYKPLLNDKVCHKCHSPADPTRGMIVIRTSMARADADVRATAKRVIVFGFLLGLMSEGFLLIILRKTVLKPLDALNKGTSFLRAGKLDHRIEIKSDDEFGALGQAFNHMASTLEKSHEHLERSVKQKTNELRVIAELSTEVFRGDLDLNKIIEQFLEAITGKMGFGYASLCFVDRETGSLSNEYKKGLERGFCSMEINLGSDHPFARAINEARPMVKKPSEIGAPESYSNTILVPLLSHQRRRCRDVNQCEHLTCPAFNSEEERCWLMESTLCRSPQSVEGRHKIFGCLHCNVFPVLGVLIVGVRDGVTSSSVHSLQILSSVIASAVENNRFIENKKGDIANLITLHDISIEKSSHLSMPELTRAIVESSTVFAGMHTSVLWLAEGEDLRMESMFSEAAGSDSEARPFPSLLPIRGSFPGQAIVEKRAIESTRTESLEEFRALIDRHDFRYAVAIPLKFKGSVSGCLTLFKKNDFLMTDSQKAIMMLFASQSAASINNSKLYSALRNEKDFSEAIFNSASTGIMVVDPWGSILKINSSGADILNSVPESVVGRRLTTVLPGSGPMLYMDGGLSREITIMMPDGVSIPLGYSTSKLPDSSGHESGLIILFRDLSEIRRLQSEIKKREYFETMGKLIAGVAHEVRNPLFGISSIGQLLERELDEPRHQTLIRALLKESGRMQRLIEELLLYTRPSKLVQAEVDLGHLLTDMTSYARAKNPNVTLSVNVPDIMLWADRDKITQVFLNLINNAIDAAKTTVSISAAMSENGVEVRVTDDGPGIAADHVTRIFEPFFTTKQGGTGLGLPISRKIIEDHGGSIEVRSPEGGGTTVIMTLPFKVNTPL